jgi:Tol biopolymer transport system component
VGAVAWKYGNRIAFSYLSGSDNLLSLINSDGSGRKDIAAGASVSYPQISSANTNEVYGISTTTYAKVDVSAVSPARTVIKSGFNGLHPSISPDGSKVAYSKSGEDSGIYLLDLTAGTETKIK